jgi:hypothetical protein
MLRQFDNINLEHQFLFSSFHVYVNMTNTFCRSNWKYVALIWYLYVKKTNVLFPLSELIRNLWAFSKGWFSRHYIVKKRYSLFSLIAHMNSGIFHEIANSSLPSLQRILNTNLKRFEFLLTNKSVTMYMILQSEKNIWFQKNMFYEKRTFWITGSNGCFHWSSLQQKLQAQSNQNL